MTTLIKIEHTHKGATHVMPKGFSCTCEGVVRCMGAGRRNPFGEDPEKTMIRLLGSAMMEILNDEIPISNAEARRLSNLAKDNIETGVMYAVKALYAETDNDD